MAPRTTRRQFDACLIIKDFIFIFVQLPEGILIKLLAYNSSRGNVENGTINMLTIAHNCIALEIIPLNKLDISEINRSVIRLQGTDYQIYFSVAMNPAFQ